MATWQQAPKPIYEMWSANSATLGNDIYFISGQVNPNEYGEYYKTQIFSTVTKNWRVGPDLLVALSLPAVIGLNNKIYCIGGREYSETVDQKYSRRVQILDTSTMRWANGASSIVPLNEGQSAAAVGDIIYYFGAYDIDRQVQYDYISAYYTTTNSWQVLNTKLLNFGTQWNRMTCVSVGRSIYCIGGWIVDIGETGIHYRFDVDTEKWTQLASCPFASNGIFAVVYGNEIYCVTRNFAQIYAYNIETNLWRLALSKPTDTSRPSRGGVVANYLYLSDREEPVYSQPTIYTNLSTVSVVNSAPASGFINEHEPQTFSWEIITNSGQVTQKSALFQWRQKGSATIRPYNINNSTQSITFPAETFPNGNIEWRVQVTGSNNVVSEFTPWMELTTIDQPPLAPINLFPSGNQEDGTKSISFSWRHRSPLSTPQTAFEIQLTRSPGVEPIPWVALSGKVASNSSTFNLAANTIIPTDPNGNVGWRVRTYNSDNVAGAWSEPAFFIVHAAPQKPTIISATPNKSRPAVTWQSTGQVGYRLQVRSGDTVFYDSGEMHGDEKSHKIRDYLLNGTYSIFLQISNVRGLWSDWTEYPVRINAPRRMQIQLTGEAIENGANLTWETEAVVSTGPNS